MVLKWVAEGLDSAEINSRAALLNPSFSVSRSQLAHYRKTREIDIEEIKKQDEYNALNTGLAIKSERVKQLKTIADKLYVDLVDKGLTWTEQVKGIGSGPLAEIVEYLEFNKAEIDAFRGILDDIAKEVGERQQKHEVTGADGDVIRITLASTKDE